MTEKQKQAVAQAAIWVFGIGILLVNHFTGISINGPIADIVSLQTPEQAQAAGAGTLVAAGGVLSTVLAVSSKAQPVVGIIASLVTAFLPKGKK